MISLRHGIMLIGETFSGKTSALKSLIKSLNNLGESQKQDDLKVRFLFN